MKKTILFIALLCGVLSLSAQNAVDTTNQEVLKYCSDNVQSPCGAAKSQVVVAQSAAIRLTQKQLVAYKDNYFVKMAVGFAKDEEWTPDTVRSVKFWMRKNLNGDNLWEQDYDTAKVVFGAWNELVFDNFYAVDGTSDLFFGYTIECGGLPIGGDGGIANSNATYIYDVSDSKWIQYRFSGNFSIKVTVAGENMPKYNLAIDVRTAEFARTDAKFDAVVGVTNTTDSVVSSFDFVISVDDKELYRKTELLEKPLEKGGSTALFVQDTLQLTAEGAYDMVYTVENINGKEKDDCSEDSRVVVKTLVSNEFENRVVMVEMFSGTMCSNCPTGHKYLHHAIDSLGKENYIWSIHHAGYNASELTVDGSYDAVQFYGFEYDGANSYAPGVMLDRVNLLSVGATSVVGLNGPVFNANEVGNRGLLEDYMLLIQKNMSPVALDVDFELDEETRMLDVTVDVQLLGNFDAKTLRVGVITVEDYIKGTQAGVAGKYYHTNIIRSFLTSAYGKSVGVIEGTIYENFSQKLKDKFVLDNMRLIVWVGKNSSTSDINGFEIYQAYEVKLTDRPYTPVEYVSDDSQLVIYQNADRLFVEGIEVGDVLSVYSMDGKLMLQTTAEAENAQLDLNGLTKGIYLLQTNGSYVKFIK